MNYAGPFDAGLTQDSPVSLGGERFSFDSKPGFVQHHESDSHVLVPDAHLLFSGEYVRIGSDLIISGDGQKLVIGNYFKGETRPALTTKDGATLSGHIADALTGHVHYAQAAAPAAGEVIGHVLKLSGSATVIRNGVSIELHIGDAVQKGDVVQTGSDSTVGLTFIDGSAFGMTSNARMVLNEMIYDPNGSSNSSLISLVQGTITFVAGQTAKNGNMRVETPVATMGIRGTAVLVEIGANDGPTKFSVLVEPDGHTGSYNLYDKTSGQLIGTVSQAGQVTFVSVGGIGQPPTAIEQLKTLADQQAEKALIQQVFQLYFPNYNPDDSNPKKFGSNTSGNNLAEVTFTTTTNNQQTYLTQIELRFAVTDPLTGITTYQNKIFYNTKAQFWVDSINAEQAFVTSVETFKISDLVHIDDPDIANGPFYDVAVPFVPGSAIIKSAVSTNPNLDANFLTQFLHINQTTGEISFDRLGFNFLGEGESVTFMVQVTARSGPDVAKLIIPITITGNNDVPNDNGAPTIVLQLSDIVGAVKEDTLVTSDHAIVSNGTITFRDVDLTDTHTVAQEFTSSASNLPGFTTGTHIGTFEINLDPEITTDIFNTGTVGWHFSLPDNDPTLQSLAEGQTITQVYTITITDIHGALVTQTVTITITGTNDAPVIGAVADTPLNEQTDTNALTATIAVAFTDVDLADVGHTAAITGVVVSGVQAGLMLDAAALQAMVTPETVLKAFGSSSGSVNLNFEASSTAFDYLAQGQVLTLTYTVAIDDHDGGITQRDFVVTITGTNDAPVIAADTSDTQGTNVHDVTEANSGLTTSGTLAVTDVDRTNTVTASVFDVEIGGTGSTYLPQGLDSATLKTMLSVDTGNIIGDADTIGTIHWTFDSGQQAFDFLAAGETLVLTYTIRATDSDSTHATGDQTVVVTVTGTNDVPVFSGDIAKTVTEDIDADVNDKLVATGTVTIADPDHDQSSFVPTAPGGIAGNNGYGTFTLDASGNWTYTADNSQNAIQQLPLGHHLTDAYDAVSADGTHQTITVTIEGTNDVPTVAAALTIATQEGNAPVVQDLLAGASDVDTGETATLIVANIRYSIDGGPESTTTPDGISFPDEHTINIDAAGITHIPAGATENIEVRYDVTDVHGATVAQTETITITGVNDQPVLAAGADFTTITEDDTNNSGQLVSSFATGITDPDDGAVKGIAITDSASQNGHWEYSIDGGENWSTFGAYSLASGLLLALDDKVRFIPDGTHGGSDTLTYVAWDQTTTATHGQTTSISGELHSDAFSQDSQTATLTVTDVNDAPVLNVMNHYAVESFDPPGPSATYTSTIHNLVASDVDGGDFEAFTLTATADHGILSLAGSESGVTVTGAGTVSLSITGLLGSLNDALVDGLTYSSGLMDTNVEHIAAILTDSHGGSDTVNFIFPQNGSTTAALIGSPGMDVISSNYGSDALTGGTGNDIFVFKGMMGNDTITDFHQGEDLIALAQSGFADFSALYTNVTDVSGNAVITNPLVGSGSITIAGVDKAHLTAADFHIV